MSSSGIKKRKVSKKLKSSWRKHVNIADVEEFLEDKRLEERLGPPIELLPNDAVFQLDTQPSGELLSSKARRKLKASRPLKCFSALQAHTNVPDPISRRNRVRSKEERRNELVKKKEEQNREKGVVKQKVIQANLNRQLDNIKRKNKPKRGEFSVDLWKGEGDQKEKTANEKWVEKNTEKHNLKGVGMVIKKTRKSAKSNVTPAIEPPHPGMSYNPSYEDHQDLLRKVADKEQTLIKEEAHLRRVTSGMFSKLTETQRDKNWLIDMSEGLPSKNKPQSDEEQSDTEFKSINPPTKNVKKTLKQKRKQKEQLQLQKVRRAKKLEKKKITDLHNLLGLVKNIEGADVKQTETRELRKKIKTLKKKPTSVLNANKFEEPDLEFSMGQDIAGNLKDLKTEGNLLTDRFKSMQKRNILAPTKRHTHKKRKVKKYTKPGHKDTDWKKTVARTFK